MTKLVEFPLAEGGSIVVEVDDGRATPALMGGGSNPLEQAKTSFEGAITKLGPIARSVLGEVKDLGPQEVTVELGIKFSADVGIILAKTSGEGSCKVTLAWKKGLSS